jgi:hypothetical protein
VFTGTRPALQTLKTFCFTMMFTTATFAHAFYHDNIYGSIRVVNLRRKWWDFFCVGRTSNHTRSILCNCHTVSHHSVQHSDSDDSVLDWCFLTCLWAFKTYLYRYVLILFYILDTISSTNILHVSTSK